MSAPARLERDGGLAVLTIDAPPLNLFDDALLGAIEDALAQLTADPPRALLFRADGRIVSGGVDVSTFAAIDGDTEAAAALWRRLLELPRAIEALPCPTVFAAHALCLTAAFELALGCDLIVAARSARFGLVERVVGLTPSMGGPQRLTERAGPGRARELIYTGALYDAETLERWNVVNRVLADEGFHDAARSFAADLAAGPTLAFAATKQIVRATLDGGLDAGDAVVPELSGALFASEDLQGAVASFLRDGPGKATFEGR